MEPIYSQQVIVIFYFTFGCLVQRRRPLATQIGNRTCRSQLILFENDCTRNTPGEDGILPYLNQNPKMSHNLSRPRPFKTRPNVRISRNKINKI